jgi:hypothetical protein
MTRVTRPAMLILAVTLAVVAGACSVGGDAGDDKAGGTGPPVQLRLANTGADIAQTPAVKYFVERVDELSGGEVRIKVADQWAQFAADAEQQVVHDVAAGEVDLGWVGSRVFDTLGVASFQALTAPMLIDSYALENAVIEGGVMEDMMEGLDELGVDGLAVLADALRRPVSVDSPILAPADWKGTSFGTLKSDGQVEAIRALGGDPMTGWSCLLRSSSHPIARAPACEGLAAARPPALPGQGPGRQRQADPGHPRRLRCLLRGRQPRRQAEAVARGGVLHGTPGQLERLLGSLPGEPKRIVCDARGGMLQAISERWPEAELHQCEWHLQHTLEWLLAKELRRSPSTELDQLRGRAEGALTGPSFWRPYVRAARAAENESLERWIAVNGPTIEAQFARRRPPSRRPVDMPLTTSALEQLTRPIVTALYPRRHAHKNRERLNRS